MNRTLTLCIATALVLAANVADAKSRLINLSGRPAAAFDVGRAGPVVGTGIEMHDVAAMSDEMMRDILATPALAGRTTAPQVIVDDALFVNESSQRFNKRMITDRLRGQLARAAQGRMTFVSRDYLAAITQEKELKEAGVVDVGTLGVAAASGGWDFRLGGRITSLDSRDPASGLSQRVFQIVFEMVDNRGVLVWTGEYSFGRASADDVVYR